MPHEQLPSCSILSFQCNYHFKSFRHTQFNTNTYIDKSLRNMYYSGVSTHCPRLTIVQSKAESPYHFLTKSCTEYRALLLICIAIAIDVIDWPE